MSNYPYQSGQNEFITQVIMYLLIVFVVFIICLYIFRSIFNIPSFLRYQKAQTRLLEEIAKNQGVDSTKVQSIISESMGWEGAPSQSAQSRASAQ